MADASLGFAVLRTTLNVTGLKTGPKEAAAKTRFNDPAEEQATW